MPRPYLFTNNDDAMNVIWHDSEFVDRDGNKMIRYGLPTIGHDLPCR